MRPRVREIYTSGERQGPMTSLTTVEALKGVGLEGDRYALGLGSYSKSKGIRDVTLVEIESVWNFFRDTGIDLHPSLLRRNIVTEGVRLSELIDTTFSIGSVRLLGLRLCPPCSHLARMLDIPEVLKEMAHKAGIYAEILDGGSITVDDQVFNSEN